MVLVCGMRLVLCMWAVGIRVEYYKLEEWSVRNKE